MEKNMELTAVAADVGTGENLYPILPCKSAVSAAETQKENPFVKNATYVGYNSHTAAEEQKQNPAAKPDLINRIAPASFLYAIFFTFCLYKNASGITYPFYAAGTIGFAVYTIKKSGISCKSGHILTMAASLLLGISNCFTDNAKIILMNKVWLFMLLTYFLMTVYFDTKRWQLGKFLENIIRLVIGSIGKMFSFFPDAQAWLNEHKGKKNTQILYVLAGAGISIPFIALVIVMLSSADVIFRKSMDVIFGKINGADVFGCILWSAAMFFFSYGMVSLLEERGLNEQIKDRRTGQPIIAVSATAVIALIYIYFCTIQVVYLFAGYGTLPAGYTYAQYARQGFFQLLFICVMNLVLVLIGLGFFKESRVLKAILLVISFCTFVMIASSAYRMLLYISVYQLTFLRIFVLWALCVIALLMAGVVGKTLRDAFPLFRYGLAVITCCYLILSFGRPDYWIARYNISAYQEQAKVQAEQNKRGEYDTVITVDTWYLRNLSADAASAIITQEGIERYLAYEAEKTKWENGETADMPATAGWDVSYIERQKARADEMSLRSYNFSRGYVRKMLKHFS